MKERSAQPAGKRIARAPSRPPASRKLDRPTAAEPTKTPKPRAPSRGSRLAAEVARLTAELQTSRALITNLQARVDVDPLTEVLNRRGFERALKRSLAYVKRYGASAALVYLDLDDFKPVNDRHGHAAGDAMLAAVAAALVREVRNSDIVARIGGDEFAALLWNVSEADAAAKAAALEAAVYTTPLCFGASTVVVGASTGIAFLGPLDTPAAVLARADAAMYGRKMQKGNGQQRRQNLQERRRNPQERERNLQERRRVTPLPS